MSIGFKAMVLCNGVVGVDKKQHGCTAFKEGPLHDDIESARSLALRHAEEDGWKQRRGGLAHYCPACTKEREEKERDAN